MNSVTSTRVLQRARFRRDTSMDKARMMAGLMIGYCR